MINPQPPLTPPPEEPLPDSPAIFEGRASLERLEMLAEKGVLNRAGFERALVLAGYIPNGEGWRRFLDYSLLALAVAFSLSGIIFFFAFNWAEMHRFTKFGLVEAGILICLGFAYYRGLNTLPGKAGLIGAAVLVGALLAVQGQVYQTGADAYTLFLYWAVFILGWAIVGLSGPLWFLWLVLLNLTLWFYGEQAGFADELTLFNLLFALNGLGLALWEVGHAWGCGWLSGRWEPRLMALAAFIFALIPTIALIWSWHSPAEIDRSMVIGTVLYLVLTGAVIFIYTYIIHDLFMLTLAAFSLVAVITSAVVHEVSRTDFEASGLLLIGLVIIVQAALAVNWLQRVARSWEVAHG
ncbi:MAG: DUF2157 domain-containing protein [Anaerolineae bacterium]|nr:DUF2157 domain-containing protein [Anaerolineales bacterium]MCQ3979862.1 DUF2157 domain-containing protein [Anaerolineae bacterium]